MHNCICLLLNEEQQTIVKVREMFCEVVLRLYVSLLFALFEAGSHYGAVVYLFVHLN